MCESCAESGAVGKVTRRSGVRPGARNRHRVKGLPGSCKLASGQERGRSKETTPGEIRLFISYDNATKQLDTVYDITPKHAEAFLERIDSSGFDMRNITTLYRLGLLVCFYDIFQHMDGSLAQVLLHQMIKCNQLRGFHAEVQKVKSLLLDIAMLNQNLNETLGSLSDAVVGLSLGQLESLLPESVQNSVLTLQQVSGWTKSQIMILAGKYLNSEKVLSFHNVSQMGELVSGIGAQSFYNMSPKELVHVVKGGLSQYAADLSYAQQEAILYKALEIGNMSSIATEVQGEFFQKVPLTILFKQDIVNPSALKDKELRRSQALFLYESLSKKTTTDDLLSTGHLMKGVTCQHIDDMNTSTFLQSFKVFENNLYLFSPYQMTCLAWKFWKVANTSIPPYLRLMLPAEYLKSVSPLPCVPFLISLQKIELDTLIFHEKKKKAIIDTVQQCLNGSVGDDYDVDLLGKLICHLSPALIQSNISPKAMATAIQQFKLCEKLSMTQKIQIKNKLIEMYGSPNEWAAETILDLGSFLALLSREEFSTLAIKFPNPVLQIASKIPGAALTDEVMSALFDAVSDYSPRANISDQRPECIGVRAPSSGDIMKLGEANACWSIQELECIDMETFTKNVELFGSIKRFNTSQLIVLKEKAKEVWGTLAKWKSYHIVSLGRIALALNGSEIEELDLSSVDTAIALSQQTEWTTDQAKAIFRGFLKDSRKSVSDLKSIDLVGLGTNVCAIDFKEISSIKTSEFSVVVARIGSLPCGMSVLREFKKKAEKVFGKSESWTSSILYDIGIIAAGLSKEDVRALRKDLMPFIHPSAIQVMPEDVFKHLSPEQISNLGPENAAMVTKSQRLHLSTMQLQSLEQTLDGARVTVQVPQITAGTTVATEVPVSDGALCSRSSDAQLYILCIIGLLKFA
ncbi:otoancorin isoform X1 [Lissotriton helveticus]